MAVIAELHDEDDSNIDDLQDLVGKTLELSQGPGTGVVLDPNRPRRPVRPLLADHVTSS